MPWKTKLELVSPGWTLEEITIASRLGNFLPKFFDAVIEMYGSGTPESVRVSKLLLYVNFPFGFISTGVSKANPFSRIDYYVLLDSSFCICASRSTMSEMTFENLYGREYAMNTVSSS